MADTYYSLPEIPGISFKTYSYDKARVKNVCELFYGRKFMKPRKLHELKLQFLLGPRFPQFRPIISWELCMVAGL